MKKTTIVILVLVLVFIAAIAGCSRTAEKMEEIENDMMIEKGYAGMGVVSSQAMMVEPMPAPEMAVMSKEILLERYDYDERYMPMPPYEEHYGGGVEMDQKIIRTSSMTIEVDDYFLASQKTEAYAKKYGGYVSNSNAYKDHNGKTRGTFTLRIPELHFDAVMAELSLLGDVERKDTNGQDVTEQYIDLEARLDNAEAHEERLVKMYENASNVKEMMQVEQQIARVRGEIERYKGQLRYMDNRVDLSTVSVTLYEKEPVVKQWGIVRALKQSIENMLTTVRVLILLLGWLLPLIFLAGIIFAIVLFARRKRRRRR